METVNPEMRTTLAFTTVRAGVKIQRWDRIRAYLTSMESHIAVESIEALRAFAAHSEGDKQEQRPLPRRASVYSTRHPPSRSRFSLVVC